MTAIAFFYVGQLDSVCCLRHLKVQMSLSRFACLFWFCFVKRETQLLPYLTLHVVALLHCCRVPQTAQKKVLHAEGAWTCLLSLSLTCESERGVPELH